MLWYSPDSDSVLSPTGFIENILNLLLSNLSAYFTIFNARTEFWKIEEVSLFKPEVRIR